MGSLNRLTRRSERVKVGSPLHYHTVYAGSRSLHISKRAFSSSFEHVFQAPSHPVSYPRWSNETKQGKTGANARRNSHDRVDEIVEGPDANADEIAMKDSQDEPPAGSSAGSSSSSAPPSSDGGDDSGSQSPPPSSGDAPPPESSAISKLSVPEVYPQVLALPIARRPLFPGFYKAVVVRDPGVVAAMKDMLARGQPYLGAFLLKSGEGDSDTITDLNSVHKVGVFAQITSVFPASGSKDDKDESLTVVLYPHRRIKITELLPMRGKGEASAVQVEELSPEGETPPPENPGEVAPNPCRSSFLAWRIYAEGT
jgi:ATP-dependent Lon protease